MITLAAAAATPPKQPVLLVFEPGVIAQFLVVFLMLVFVYVMTQRAKAGAPVPPIRKLPGLEAVDEAIGRATEMGRPVHYSVGLGDVSTSATFAGWAALGYVAKMCAQYDTKLINTNRNYLVMSINEEIIRQAYLEAGRPDAFNPDDVRYLSGSQFAYATGVLGIFQREKPAANFMIGYFYAESLLFAEGGYLSGAIQIAGTTNTTQLAFFMAACDYTLLGEEIFAASAYLSKEPVLVGSVVGQDLGKILTFCIIIIGTILQNIQGKSNWLSAILKK
jgi:hypothetical protein